MPKFPQPPSRVTGEMADYLRRISTTLNKLPNFSFFTQQTPNGFVLGVNGDFAVYNGSTSTVSHIWVNQSANTQSVTSAGWSLVGTNITTQVTAPNTIQRTTGGALSVATTTTLALFKSDAFSGDATITLPTVASYGAGRVLFVKQLAPLSGFTGYVVPQSGEAFDSPFASNYTLGTTNASVGIASGTTGWFIVSQSSS